MIRYLIQFNGLGQQLSLFENNLAIAVIYNACATPTTPPRLGICQTQHSALVPVEVKQRIEPIKGGVDRVDHKLHL